MLPTKFPSLWALLSLLVTACAPLVNRPGPATQPPRLERAHFTASDGAILPVRSWLPAQDRPKAVVIALHGFNDYSRFFEAPGLFLSGQGIACYAYDQRGFGHAPGRGIWAGIEAYTDDLADFTDAVRKRHPGVPVFVLGESMGGAVAMVAITGPRPPRADGVILSAPAVWGRETMPWYQSGLLTLTTHTVPWLRLTGEGLHVLPSDNLAMLRALGRDPLVIKATRIDAMAGLADLMDAALSSSGKLKASTLLLYGERDQVIPKEPVLRMMADLENDPAVRTAFYERGYHMLLRDLSAEKPLSDILAWIGDHAAPLPSGADKRVPKAHGTFPPSLADLGTGSLRPSRLSPSRRETPN